MRRCPFFFLTFFCWILPLEGGNGAIPLPEPELSGVTLESALKNRRSVREFGKRPLSFPRLAALLWAAQGVTDRRGYRTAPSAGALYPLRIYLALRSVKEADAGIYRYDSLHHTLLQVRKGDASRVLLSAALGQGAIREAAAVFVIAADYGKTASEYGKRGMRYVHIEAGHAVQNILLEAAALGLGAVEIGGFDDGAVKKAAGLNAQEEAVTMIAVGYPK